MSTQVDNNDAEPAKDTTEEGGTIKDTTKSKPVFNELEYRAKTAGKLAFVFAGIFAGALAVHYAVI